MQWIGIFLLTIGLTALFSIIVSGADIKNVMANWDKRRCEIPIMFSAFLFKPGYDTRSSSDFSTDNFQFCINKMAKEVGAQGMAPFFAILGQQVTIANGVAPIMNNMRGMISKSWGDFGSILNEKYRIFSHIMVNFSTIFQRMKFAMGRVAAIGIAIVYQALSLGNVIINTLKLSMVVVLIVSGILSAMMFFMWFTLLPLQFAIILPTMVIAGIGLSTLNSAGDAGDTSGFCCDPHALVKMKDGTYKHLYEVHICDELYSQEGTTPNIVEGVMLVEAKGVSLVSIEGVLMSGTHRVLHNGIWLLAREHPDVAPPPPGTHLERLICLNTTKHSVPLEKITVGDWEEVSTDEGRKAWIDFVATTLGTPCPPTYPKSVPLAKFNSTDVFDCKMNKWVSIQSVRLGDIIAGKRETGVVKAIYYGNARMKSSLSDGVWIKKIDGWSLDTENFTERKEVKEAKEAGIFLVTDSGSFLLRNETGTHLVRDFTEVGEENLESCYEMLSNILQKGG